MRPHPRPLPIHGEGREISTVLARHLPLSKIMSWVLLAVLLVIRANGQVAAQTETECPPPLRDSSAPSYYLGLGQVHFNGGNFSQAVVDYTCAITAQPDYAPAYANRGYAYAALGDSDKAFADYNQAITLDEALTSAYTNRGTLYARLGNFGLAINDFTLVIGLLPNDPVAYNDRGVVHAAEKNFDLAIADLQQAISLDPNYTTPYASLAAVYSALAAQNYQTFVAKEGVNARLPAGTPDDVLNGVDDSLRTGNFSVWLPLLTPAT
jgi:tetratricopeptide (TPR) repeat protein